MKTAQIQNEDAVCVVCREGITNPICPDCLAMEIKNWNNSINLSRPDFGNTLVGEGVRCIFCGKVMSICAHCYARDVYDSLIEEQPELGEEFIETFDFGLKRELL